MSVAAEPAGTPSAVTGGEAAKIKVNRTPPKVQPPPLVAVFSASPSDDEIFRARVFEEPLVPIGKPTLAENRALARALTARLRARSEDVTSLESYLAEAPASPWRASLLLNLGLVYRGKGYFSKALAAWRAAWTLAKAETDARSAGIADRAIGELLTLHMRLGDVAALESLFGEIEGRNVRGAAGERVAAAREGLWVLRYRHHEAIPSGPTALDRVLALGRPEYRTSPKIAAFHATPAGATLLEIAALAESVGSPMQVAYRLPGSKTVVPAVAHLKVGHFSALVVAKEGEYLLQDAILGTEGELRLSEAAFESEVSGFFLVREGALPAGWRKATDAEAASVRGRCLPIPTQNDFEEQEPDDVKTKPEPAEPEPNDGDDDEGEEEEPEKDPWEDCFNGTFPGMGLARYNFHAMLASLNITDIPVGYAPPRGPAVALQVTYNQRDIFQPQIFSYSNLGHKWTFNWLSYVVDDPSVPTANAGVYVPGGGHQTYTGFSGQAYAAHWRSRAVLGRTSQSPIRYERTLPNGSLQVFAQPDGAATYPRKVFMTEWKDPQGNTLTFNYDASLRLVSVTDAIGQVTLLAYTDSADPLRITRVTDPFGRFATFDYDSQGQLARITDVIGMKSEFQYGTADFVSALATPYGTTNFTEGSAGLGGGGMGVRWLEAADPLGGKERLEYVFGPYQGITPPTEPYSAVPAGLGSHNVEMNKRNSYYWGKRAMAVGPGDYQKARIYHWLHTPGTLAISGIPASVKRPLQNRVWYTYPNQTSVFDAGTGRKAAQVARVLDNGTTQLYQRQFNSRGRLTSRTDSLGRQTLREYDTNDIDLLRIKQLNGAYDLLASVTHNTQHRPLTVTDAAGQVWTWTYNAQGQPLTLTTPPRAGINENRTTTFGYDASGYLQSVTGPLSGATASLSYDGYGRVRTVTDSEGYTLTIDYDALDRPTRSTFPDGTYEEVGYQHLDVSKRRDRLGRWSYIFYDALRRPTVTRDPLGRTINRQWCTCGTLDKLVDANGNATSWERDLQARPLREIRADGSVKEFTWENVTSRLKKIKDAKNQEIQYSYFGDGRLQQVSYVNAPIPTPSVSFTYDAYGRLATMVDGNGTTTYGYHPVAVPPALGAGHLASVDGPLANDTASYTYDEPGRVFTRALNGVNTTWSYDALGRISSLGDPVGTFAYAYVGATGRPQMLTYPNGQTTSYAYYPNAGDQRLQEIHHQVSAGGATLSKFGYAYDAVGSIKVWTQQLQSNPANAFDLANDFADQLKSAIWRTTGMPPSVLKNYVYSYDQAGNRTTEQIDNAATASTHNNMNRLLSQQAGGALTLKGTLSEPSTVMVAGKAAVVTPQNTFEGQATVGQGTSTVPVVATDSSGNVRTNTYEVTQTGTSRTLTYDANGNLTGDGTRTFEWDGANRLTRVLNGGPEVARFVYDGWGRRYQKIAGGVTTTYVYAAEDIIEERLSTGTTYRYIHGPGIDQPLARRDNLGAVSYYLADHLGSIVQVTDATANVTLSRQYDAWGNLLSGSTVGGYAFTGREWDPETGLYYYRARYYDPSIGRFLSTDPIGLTASGINLYEYVENRPALLIDPTGHFWVAVAVTAAIVVAAAAYAASQGAFGPFAEEFVEGIVAELLPKTVGTAPDILMDLDDYIIEGERMMEHTWFTDAQLCQASPSAPGCAEQLERAKRFCEKLKPQTPIGKQYCENYCKAPQ